MTTVTIQNLHDGYALLEVTTGNPWHGATDGPRGACSAQEARVAEWIHVLVDIGAWAKPGEDVSYGLGGEPWVGPIPMALAEAVAPSLRTMLTEHAKNGCSGCRT